MTRPLISIIIPTYNRAGKVCRALDSVLRQSFPHFEVHVVDDGSTDDTLFWLNATKDPRLFIHTQTHGGVAKARNEGVKHAKADWISFLDSDDVWRTHKLSEQVRFHHQNPELLISHTEDLWLRKSRRVSKPKKYLHRAGDLFETSLKTCVMASSTLMMRKDLFIKAEGFNESFPTCEDYDLWLKLTCEHHVGFIPKVLATKFGGHTDQLSMNDPFMEAHRLRSLESLLNNPRLNLGQKNKVEIEIETRLKKRYKKT